MASRADAAGVARVMAAMRGMALAATQLVETAERLVPVRRPASEPAPRAPQWVPDPGRAIPILHAVAFETGLRIEDLIAPSKRHPLVRARSAVAWVARRVTDRSLRQIGLALGGRDNSTILSLIAKAEGLRDSDPAFRMLTDRLIARFSGQAA